MFIISAVVQPAKHAPWLKVQYASQNNDVQWHMSNVLQKEYFDVTSVKSEVATDSELAELRYGAQGNTRWINNAPLELDDANDAGENSPTEPNTGSSGPPVT